FTSAHLALDARGLLFERVGFETIDGPELGEAASPAIGLGRADEATIEALIDWVGEARADEADAPYFALLTLQSARERRGVDRQTALASADAALGKLLEWYRTEEAERGTVLVLFSDHASQSIETPVSEE